LRQIGGLVEEVDLKEGARPFGGRGGDDGGVDVDEAVVVEPVDDGALDGRPHAHDGPLLAGAQPQVTEVHQEFNAVLFGRDGVIGNVLQDVHRLQPDLIAAGHAGSAIILAHATGHHDGRFLADSTDGLKGLFVHLRPEGHGLDDAGAISHL